MKILLVAEYRNGKLLDTTYELMAFAEKMGAEAAMVAKVALAAMAGTLTSPADRVASICICHPTLMPSTCMVARAVTKAVS